MLRLLAIALGLLVLAPFAAQASPPAEVATGDGWFSSCHALRIVVPAHFVLEVASGPVASVVVVEAVPGPESLCPQAWTSSFVADVFDPAHGVCVDNTLGERLCLTPHGPATYALDWTAVHGHAWGTIVFAID